MANGKVEKIIEFQAQKAISQLDQVINRLNKTNEALKGIEKQASAINFEKFIPAISKFASKFEKIKINPQNLTNIQLMAQALNRFRMTTTELNKKNVNVTFEKVTKAIYSFSNSIGRMKLLSDTINKIASLGLAINRLVNSSMKLQNMKVSFTSLTQAIYAFVGSILRIKDLDSVIVKLERLANAMEKLRVNSKNFTVVRDFAEFEKTKKKISSLEEKIKNLKEENKNLKEEIKKLNEETNKTPSILNKVQNMMGSLQSTIGTIVSYLRFSTFRSLFYTMQRLGKWIYETTRAYASYVENINLATVAYYGLEDAMKSLYPFAEKISIAFGLNESEVIRAIGLFKQMSNAMQLTQEQGDLLSTGLTKMAYDISSLYNISFDRAISALQSALVGQTKPIRSATGADITENTLRMTLQDLGIEKEIRELSFVEKRLVMVISLTKQLANAQGDLANTIESPANQLKILSQQLERLRIALGEFFEIGMNYILPLLNGIIMAMVVVVEAFTDFVKNMIGYEEDKFNYDGLKGTNDEVGELIDGMEEANKQAEELEKHLIGIDELNILDPNTSITTDGIDPTILDAFNAALKDWDNKMDSVTMKAYQIRDIILSWLGLEPNGDGSWGLKEGASLARTIRDIMQNLDFAELIEELGKILSILGRAVLYLIAWKVITNPFLWLAAGVYNYVEATNGELEEGQTLLDKFEQLLLSVTLLTGGIALLFRSWDLGIIALSLFGVYETMKGLNDAVSDGVWHWQDMQKVLFGVAALLLSFFLVSKDWIFLIMAGIAVVGVASLQQLVGFEERFKSGTTTILDWLALIFMGLLHGIVFVAEAIIKGLLLMITLPFTLVIDFVVALGLGLIAIVEGVIDLIVAGINAVLKIVNAITGSKLKIQIDYFSATKSAVQKLAEDGGFATGQWLGGVLGTSVASSIDDAVMSAIKSDTKELAKTQNNNNASVTYDEMTKNIKELLGQNKNALDVSNSSLKEQEKQTAILGASSLALEDIAKIYSEMDEGERHRILNGTYVLPQGYANGGYPNKGLFLMNEGNSAEMVGSLGGKTAVVNNEQIASALAQALAPMLGSVVTAVENVAASDRPIVLNVDSRQMARASQKGSQKLGYNQIGGEFANV